MTPPYRSPTGLARIVLILLALTIPASLVVVWIDMENVTILETIQEARRQNFDAEPLSEEETTAHDELTATLVGVWFLIVVATTAAWLTWFHRLYANLPALGAHSLRSTPGGAVGIWFIPLLNLVRPYEIAQEIWANSRPSPEPPPAPGDPATRSRQSSSLLKLWWGFWIGWNVLAVAASILASNAVDGLGSPSSESAYHQAMDSLRTAAGLTLFADALNIPAAILAMLVVRSMTARQKARASLLRSRDAGFPADATGGGTEP